MLQLVAGDFNNSTIAEQLYVSEQRCIAILPISSANWMSPLARPPWLRPRGENPRLALDVSGPFGPFLQTPEK